jgi:ABC-type polysaccharide/polyol phosphate transport system ATPase subunit
MSAGNNGNGKSNGGGLASIRLEGLSLRFRRYGEPNPLLKKAVIDAVFRRPAGPTGSFVLFDALNLQVDHGERLGIIGANGAGKTTLLKLVCGIYTPSAGTIRIRGRIAPILELGTGFSPEMSGVDNIYFNGALLGFSRREMADKVDRILDFAGLRDVAQTPVKYYSTGMILRLAFATATDVDPEILLVDEVFAAGDAEFVGKAKDRMMSLIDASHIVVVASHDLSLIAQLCTRVLWLDRGRIAADGPPADVCRAYLDRLGAAPGPARVQR